MEWRTLVYELINIKGININLQWSVKNYDHTTELLVEKVIPVYLETIRKAALVLTTMPPTQFSVEKLFSTLKIVNQI